MNVIVSRLLGGTLARSSLDPVSFHAAASLLERIYRFFHPVRGETKHVVGTTVRMCSGKALGSEYLNVRRIMSLVSRYWQPSISLGLDTGTSTTFSQLPPSAIETDEEGTP